MKAGTRIITFLKAGAALCVGTVTTLFCADEETEERPLSEGSELFGEYNFRTGKMDAGADPEGWYEEDL